MGPRPNQWRYIPLHHISPYIMRAWLGCGIQESGSAGHLEYGIWLHCATLSATAQGQQPPATGSLCSLEPLGPTSLPLMYQKTSLDIFEIRFKTIYSKKNEKASFDISKISILML